MNNGYIAVLDSGIGGISLLKELEKIMPNERYLYFGDNLNAPYGSKNIKTLKTLTEKNIDLIKRYNVKVIALGCNTLSVNLLREIEDYSSVKTFGVFPPVEGAIINGKTLLLATERTAEKYQAIPNLITIGLKHLAIDIETNAFCLDKICFSKHLYNKDLAPRDLRLCQTVILGCTHYNFIKNKIFDHLKPQKIISGEIFTARQVKFYLENQKSLVNYKRNEVLFVGESAKFNKLFYETSGQR